MKTLNAACQLIVLFLVIVVGGTFLLPSSFGSINSGWVFGAGNLTTTGAVPFQSGTVGQVTQSSTLTFVTPTLTLPALGVLKITSGCSFNFVADNFIRILNNATTGTCELQFGPSSAQSPDILAVRQVNPYFQLRDSTGGSTVNLRIPAQASATGVRYVCIDTNGQLTSQAAACVGT